MKRSTFFTRKGNVPVILLLFCAVVLNSCKKTAAPQPDDPCGIDVEWYSLLHVDNHITTYETLTGGRVKYYLEELDIPMDLCADYHTQCLWLLTPKTTGADPELLEVAGKAYWKGLQGKVTTLTYGNPNQYFSHESVGLKMAYQNEPAWIAMNMQITINDQGSDALNRTFLKDHIQEMKVIIRYKEHK
jgi:hypothetical protein